MTPRRIPLAIPASVWHKFRVPIFVERFVLAVCAAIVIALAVTNPMGCDIQQRVSGALAIIFFAYFVAHTVYKRSLPPPVAPPPKTEAELPATRPQLLIVKWGQIDLNDAAHVQHVVQHGFTVRNFGLGETALGVRVSLSVPADVPDIWSNGEGSGPTVAIGKDQDAFVPVWRKLGIHMLSRWDLQEFLAGAYRNKPPGQ